MWEFFWREKSIFGTTFVLSTLTKDQDDSNEKSNQI
jgi:hypothetical protein